ncbi:hypothetical protein KKF61_00475 [Patescibacteria group bacterium]|nr:hypothetical protein [Patescibacteria group bacterium]MBU0964532.1 hypothetical protein [Patescibacteria group bacterium]
MPVNKKKNQKNSEDMLGLVSHKFKGPLTTINLYSEAMLIGQVGKISKEQKEYLDEIHKASKKMTKFINDYVRSAMKEKK